jgi:heparan-sulfate lyase
LHRHIERYSSPNNHWIGEATALYLLGSFFPEFDEASRWKKQAWDILAAEPENQFYADGGSAEQSTSYHHYCLGFFLLAMMTRLRQKLPVPQSMRKRLEAAMDFSLWMTTPDGTVPRIGDAVDSLRAGGILGFPQLFELGSRAF